MLHTVLAGRVEPMVRPWMVVLADARVLGRDDARPATEPDPAVRTLTSHGIPVILVSFDEAARARALQSALGIRAPFICGGGAELHVPDGYFDERLGCGRRSEGWNVIEFHHSSDAPRLSRVIQSLLLLYWSHRDDGMVVGVSDREQTILSQSNIPILVRNSDIDQTRLREQLPDAYYTSGIGAAGWAEGILGPVER